MVSTSNSRTSLEDELDKLENSLTVQIENGLTGYQDAQAGCSIAQSEIANARGALSKSPPDELAARAALANGRKAYDEALAKTPGLWRIVNIYGLLWLAVFVAWSVGIGLALYGLRDNGDLSVFSQVPFWVPLYGALGAVLQGFTSVIFHVHLRTIRRIWLGWFVFCPFIGAVTAIIAFFLLDAGFRLWSAEGGANGASGQRDLAQVLVSILAGYKWGWVTGVLDKIPALKSPA